MDLIVERNLDNLQETGTSLSCGLPEYGFSILKRSSWLWLLKEAMLGE